MVIEQQISARRERAHGSIVRILTRPDGNLYGDYSVRSASNKTYRVAMRGPGLFDNYCSCPDFAVNTLGTCKHIEALLARLRKRRGKDPLAGLLKTSLLSYQVRGTIFAACRGRVILADDMGLGKTVQALAATEFLRRSRGIQRVLIVAPASVKYQWKKEIEKFTGL